MYDEIYAQIEEIALNSDFSENSIRKQLFTGIREIEKLFRE